MDEIPCCDVHAYMHANYNKFRAIIILPTLQDLATILTSH